MICVMLNGVGGNAEVEWRCPKHVEIFMICIKLVPLAIFIYDARSHIHQYILTLE